MTYWKIAALVAVVLLAPAVTLHAADGDLDTSFGGTGVVTVPYAHLNCTARGVAVQPDGKIVTVGGTTDGAPNGPYAMALARLNPDGTLDTGFGSGGMVDAAIPNAEGGDVGLQSDGKIVVAARPFANFVLARFASDGSLDTSFGTGGTATADCGNGTVHGRLAVAPDDKLLVAAGTCVLRFTPDGALDTTFGAGGIVSLTQLGTVGLALQPDGKIVLAAEDGGLAALDLVRLGVDGVFDEGFGSHGIAAMDLTPNFGKLEGAALQPNGRIVGVGIDNNGGDFTVARYLANGKADTSFGADGIVETTVSESEAQFVVVQDDGKPLVVGAFSHHVFATIFSLAVPVARYDADGTLDPTFGTGGMQTYLAGPFGTGGIPGSVRLQADGKAVIGATNLDTVNTESTANVVRIHALTIGCPATPTAGCKGTVAAGRSKLQIKTTSPATKNQIKWKWSGAATTLAELGDPVATDPYRVCLYDDGNGGVFLRGAILAAGGTCRGKPCWRANTKGFAYVDSAGVRFGITKLKLKAGLDGKAQIGLQGRGAALPLPPLPAPLPLRMQLSSGNGTCWEATFSSGGLKTNDAERFQGASD